MECYDPTTNTWTLLTGRMNIGRSYAGYAVIDQHFA
ncbi:unnamed protein product [Protopolystoma xenopodis]|uniref:Uncharacterized protein n=1 Tax=Protopolystoma xenopodis TaxID=117903 RepID=A0A448XRT5_9PLAT|nr:unnamed protein product [Protopolystoma xenopodis]